MATSKINIWADNETEDLREYDLKYSKTCVQRPPQEPKKVLTGGH